MVIMDKNALSLIGKKPLIDLGSGIYGKAEFLNPSGSIKDVMMKYMVEAAENRGELRQGCTIVEATSGNTGIALSMTAAINGCRARIFMPRRMSVERRKMMLAFGAELELTDTMEEARELARKLGKRKDHFYINQFENQDNTLAHYYGTGKEILEQMKDIRIDSFVAGIGTGGTIMGAGKAIREGFPDAEIIGMMPASPNEENEIEGIGHYYCGEIVDEGFFDMVVEVSNRDAFSSARFLAKKLGLFVGPSSGANYFAARKFGSGNRVTLLPDSANRYLSTGLFG